MGMLIKKEHKARWTADEIKGVARRTGIEEDTIKRFYTGLTVERCIGFLKFHPLPQLNVIAQEESSKEPVIEYCKEKIIEEGSIIPFENGSIAVPNFNSERIVKTHEEFESFYRRYAREEFERFIRSNRKTASVKGMRMGYINEEKVLRAAAVTLFVNMTIKYDREAIEAIPSLSYYDIASLDEIIESGKEVCKGQAMVCSVLMMAEGLKPTILILRDKDPSTTDLHAALMVDISNKRYYADPTTGIFGDYEKLSDSGFGYNFIVAGCIRFNRLDNI